MELHNALLYSSLVLFIGSIVLWYISGTNIKHHKPAMSRKMVYIGGFMFSFSILAALAGIIIWTGK